MPNTPAGIPYPAGTDPIANGDDAIHALALALCGYMQMGRAVVTVAANQRTGFLDIVYPAAFATVARIWLTANAQTSFVATASNNSTTGCRITCATQLATPPAGPTTCQVDWLAIG